ncbi:tigger transposable element-derived protein 6-like [Ornithodoros turicata]|uniref:tigger transposable element-derived protein 6-like n=1 Tax=Ornithodoros turicata TaxID=34597 RepID=UPI0031391840
MDRGQQKRKVISLNEKVDMIEAVSSGRKKLDVARDFGVSPSTLYMWFLDIRARNIRVSGATLQQKAKEFASILGCDDFKGSSGWLQRFKNRHDVVGKTLSGESRSVDQGDASEWISTHASDLLARFDVKDIYNADETGLFYQMLPNKTLDVKGDRCHGGKQSKQRLTVLLCANMDGTDKRVPLVIGKSAKPRCFKGHSIIPMKYASNTKAWMTRAIFSDWLKEFNEEMRRKGRKICLLLDNCTAHHIVGLNLPHIELRFFPANSTSLLQPLDQGVIRSVKCAYRERLIQRLLLNLRLQVETKVDIYVAMKMLSAAWTATQPSTVANCFRHAGFKQCESSQAAQECDTLSSVADAWQALRGGVRDDIELEDFIDMDQDVVATEELAERDIVDSVREEGAVECCDDDDHDVELSVPTQREVLDAIDVLRRFAGAQDNLEKAMEAVSVYERHVMPCLVRATQSKITDFFVSK